MMANCKQKTDTVWRESILNLIKKPGGEEEEYDENTKILILDAMGGINNILNQTLQNDSIFGEQQLEKIHQILRDKSEQKTKIKKDDTRQNSNGQIESNEDIFLTLDVQNNYLFSLCSNNLGTKIYKGLHSRYYSILFILLLFFGILLTMLSGINETMGLIRAVYFVITFILFFIPSMILWILTTNKIAFNKNIRTTEFWIQLIYMIRWLLLVTLKDFQNQNDMMLMIFWVCVVVFWILFIIWFLLFDGIKLNLFVKRGTLALVALFFTFGVVFNWVESNAKPDDSLIHIYGDYSISLRDQIQSTVEVLGILFIKQLISSILRKEKAFLIVYRPTIVWNDDIPSKPERQLSAYIQEDDQQDEEDQNEHQ
eukprot:203055_1